MNRPLSAGLVCALAALTLGGPAQAAPRNATLTGSLTVDGGHTSVVYGDTLTFRSTVQGDLPRAGRAYVRLICGQNGVLVFRSDHLVTVPAGSATVTLTDQGAANYSWDGGAAVCWASLEVVVNTKRSLTVTPLDRIEFGVAGVTL
jgi:hypothetical protein